MRFARRWKLKCSLVRKERKIITRSVHQNSENEFRQTINETHNQSQTNFFVKLVKRNCWNYDNEILSSREKCKLKMATKLLTKTWTRWNINCLVWLHQVEHNRNNNWKNAKKMKGNDLQEELSGSHCWKIHHGWERWYTYMHT